MSTYLVAWLDTMPVGHLNLRWRGPDEPAARTAIGALPVHTALAVVEDSRRRGIGADLIRSAEALAAERGHAGACLAVALDNPNARRLYERLGYSDCGAGAVESSWPSADAHGRPTMHTERVVYLARRWA